MSQQEKSTTKGHARNKSATKPLRPRSSTKGPLDVGDTPLADPLSSPSSQLSPGIPHRSPSQRSPRGRSPMHSPAPAAVRTTIAKDFKFLLRPEIYHPVASLNVPASFRRPADLPEPDATLADLLATGHFRAAAVAAAQELTSESSHAPPIDPSDHRRIFDLLYTRLACLTLIEATDVAAQEVRALGDMNNAAIYVDETTGEHLVPWELRVLNVRLQAIGFGDPRRSVMSYHDLAREAREQITRAAGRHDNSARELWKARLVDLGVRVAGALIEMDDIAGAHHHLSTLKDGGDGKMTLAKALLWLHLGDVDQARACVNGVSDEQSDNDTIVLALCDMADGNYQKALEKWQELKEHLEDEMVGVNMGVCLLYTGRMNEGRDVLEGLVDSGFSSHTLLFNLSTMYELCTEKNRMLKMRLADKVAGLEHTARGWEKNNSDFKL